jgi:hypothetical protein
MQLVNGFMKDNDPLYNVPTRQEHRLSQLYHPVNRLVKTFVNILKLTFNRQIGLYC